MRTIFVDAVYRCHITGDGAETAVETEFFDGKCDAFVEGYCYDTSKGYPQIYPWKPLEELDALQRAYEQALRAEYETLINELYEQVVT